MIEKVVYGGWENNVKLSNGSIELVATLDVGPRVIRFSYIGGPNVMKEYPEQLGGRNESEWMIRGGHRLWLAPEAKPRSYAPDNAPVQFKKIGEFGMRLTPIPEAATGVQKQMNISMAANEDLVTITHRLTNIGPWAIELALWAPTVMDAGGMVIVPLPEKQPHTEVVTPDFPLVLWPYSDMSDSRIHWGSRYITMTQDTTKGPNKFGLALELGWAAYQVHDVLFVKYFDFDPGEAYPDFGCNFQTFTNEEMLEVESLGPLTLLEPGDTVEHDETWRLFPNVPRATSEDEIDRLVRPLA